MTLAFRNVDASPEDPVDSWPLEAVQAALERGSLTHWQELATAIALDPWGRVARAVEEVLCYTRPYGVAELMERVLTDARSSAELAERAEVAAEIAGLVAASGLTQAEFAARIGTSASRLSTYVSAKVVPSATALVRMRRAVGARSA